MKNKFLLTASDNGVTTSYNGGTSNAYGLITQSRTTAGGKTLVTSYAYDKGLRVNEITYPDAMTVNYSYNGTGFLESIGSGKKSGGNTAAYASGGTYNTAGQLTSLMAGNGKITTRTWGSTTGLLEAYGWGLPEYNERTLAWDNRGNITSIVKGTTSSPYTSSYTYDIKNRLTSETSGAKVNTGSRILTNASYRYAANDVSGKADGAFSSETVRLDYNASSVIIDLGSDMEVNQVNIYGRNSRISPEYLELWTRKAGSESWEKAEDESLSWKQTAEGWTVYFVSGITAEQIKLHSTWDERDAEYNAVDKSTFSALAGNIFEVSFAADGKESFWTYDAKGNRLSETERTGGIYSPVQRVTYYPNTDLIKQYGEWYFNYDRNGSLTARGKSAVEKSTAEKSEEENLFASWNFDATAGEVWYYEYDMSGRMTGSGSSKKGTEGLTERATYAYDYRGLLVSKKYAEFTADEDVSINGGSTATVTEWYEYTQDGKLLYTEKSDGSGVKKTDYIWAETTLWCEVDDGKVYYHHTDHLGTTEVVTDSTGKVVWHAEYEAFGSVISENGSMAFTPSFTGKMMDECSGLYYFNARWYDSECGRFTTSDPVRDGVNFHNYCNGNPITRIDKDGRNADYVVDDENHTVTITVPITIYGSGASDEIAKTYEDGINNAWAGDWKTTINGQEYTVSISANVSVGDEPSNPSKNDSSNYIKVDANTSRSYVKGGYKGEWRKNGRLGNTLENDNPVPHETGHLLGLDDRYHDVQENGRTYSKPNEGWECNIMGGGSVVEQRNIDGVMRALPDLSKKKSGTLKAGRMSN